MSKCKLVSNFFLTMVLVTLISAANVSTATLTVQEEQPKVQVMRLIPTFSIQEMNELRAVLDYAEGVKYRQGLEVTADPIKAFTLINAAADKGYASAEYDLAVMCRHGKGAPLDLEKALYWYKRASDHGSAPAANELGAMYELGNAIVQADKEKAIEFYQRAMDGGYKLAMTNLERLLAE